MSDQRKTKLIDGSLYRVGVHGKLFRLSGDEWVLSSKTHTEFEVADDPAVKKKTPRYQASCGVREVSQW